MIETIKKTCSGCSACANICPNHCIEMKENEEGFLYPFIDKNKCIKCELCSQTCPIIKEQKQKEREKPIATYGAIHKKEEVLFNSSSGGIFTELANYVLASGGCVFGAAFSGGYRSVIHVKVENAKEVQLIQGSKYMQSEMGNCFLLAKTCLEAGQKVLFSGTPCQILGLKSFLNHDYENLICVEIICHGVPSKTLWNKYLDGMKEKLKEGIDSVSFRDKTSGCRPYAIRLSTKVNSFNENAFDNPYMHMFLKDYCLRESCYNCSAKNIGKLADISIGDFWGVEKQFNNIDMEKGVSLVIIHTIKGKEIFEIVRDRFYYFESDYNQSILENPSYSTSVKRPAERDYFYYDLEKLSWYKFERKYCNELRKSRLMKKLKKSMPCKLIKRFLRSERFFAEKDSKA